MDDEDDDVRDLFVPDLNATHLDRAVMLTARRLHDAGWTQDALTMAGEAAELREAPHHVSPQPSARELYDTLKTVSESADWIAETIARTHPDEIALNRKGD